MRRHMWFALAALSAATLPRSPPSGSMSDEAGMNSATFTPPPAGGTIQGQWNAWNHLKVVPEPGSLLLLSIGLAGAGFARRGAAG